MHYHLTSYLIVFSLAAYSSVWWPSLPNLPFSVATCLAIWLLTRRWRNIWPLLLALFSGVLWATLWGYWLLADALPVAKDKSDYLLTGVVRGLPENHGQSTRFIFEVESARPVEPGQLQASRVVIDQIDEKAGQARADVVTPVTEHPTLKRLQLNWYGTVDLQPGQRWQLEARLRSPRGFSNPGGFDYRLWLLRKGVSATGYVRNPEQSELLEFTRRYPVDRYRQAIRAAIYQVGKEDADLSLSNTARHLLVALTIGEKGGLSGEIWQQLRVSGTIHLLVISGLHISMAAAVGMLLGSLLGRGLAGLGFNCSHILIGGSVALLFAASYALMAGFSLPTQRALIMLSVFFVAILVKRALRPWLAFTWALALQAVFDPLAPISSGFWLSYGAVAVFIWYFSSHPRSPWLSAWLSAWLSVCLPPSILHRLPNQRSLQADKKTVASRLYRLFSTACMGLQTLVEVQLLVLLMLSGVLIYFQGSASLLAPLINVLVLPWFSLLIVPLALLGVLVFPVSTVLASKLWWLAAYQLESFLGLLDKVSAYGQYSQWHVISDQYFLVAATVVLSGLFLLLPRGLGMRAIACVLIIALVLIKPPEHSDFEVVVLDVGQGLSVVVLTPDGIMVYDAGRKYSDSFDIGSAVVAPYLQSRGVKNIDMLVVSHSDADHSGGVPGLLSQFSARRVIAGQPEQLALDDVELDSLQQCREGMKWQWGDVVFEVIHPGGRDGNSDDDSPDYQGDYFENEDTDNASSCVIIIHRGQQSILLSGDIEADVELALLTNARLPSNVTLLVAPHHGSRTSSTEAFVAKTHPSYVVYSAGYRHHFGHPHPVVKQRYANINAQQFSTGESGAVSFLWRIGEDIEIKKARESLRVYWKAPY